MIQAEQTPAEVFLGLVRLMVDQPNAIRLEESICGSTVTYVLSAPESDAGKLIGKQGRTARSLRTILAVISMTSGQSINLDIVAQSTDPLKEFHINALEKGTAGALSSGR